MGDEVDLVQLVETPEHLKRKDMVPGIGRVREKWPDPKNFHLARTAIMNPVSGNTSRVAANSFWYGFDSLLGIVMAFGISIPMARILGPERLGYFNYIMWLTAMSGSLACLGIPATTGKYMAEFLGSGNPGLARSIYRRSLWAQGFMALAVTLIALALLYRFGDPKHHLVSTLQILATIPAMLVQIPTQANVANESMRTNIPGSVISNVLILISVPLSLYMHWDLVGIAIGMLVGRTVDFLVRSRSTDIWVNRAAAVPIPRELNLRMRGFALQMTYISILAMVIWDKSDLVLLKALTSDIRQITYFTVSYNLVEKVVLAPAVFASSISASLLAQYGRDQQQGPGDDLGSDALSVPFSRCHCFSGSP